MDGLKTFFMMIFILVLIVAAIAVFGILVSIFTVILTPVAIFGIVWAVIKLSNYDPDEPDKPP